MQISHVRGSGQSTSSVNAAAFVRTASSVQNLLYLPISGMGTVALKACRSCSAVLQWGSNILFALSLSILSYPVNRQSFFVLFVGSVGFSWLIAWWRDTDLDLYPRFLLSDRYPLCDLER